MIDIDKKYKNILHYGVLIFFIILTSYKITNSSLWYDETVEYWYSKILIGKIPFEQSGSMYERIIGTFQPPLYNFLMFFWLKISSSVWWFRFFGVVCGVIGINYLYKTIELTINSFAAVISVIFATFTYQLVYYWQEASEYCLLLMGVFACVYYWCMVLKEYNKKDIILFTIWSVVSMYSQYGAVFVVIPFSVSLAFILYKEKRTLLKSTVYTYLIALICGGGPLYLFFLQEQLKRQHRGATYEITFQNNIFIDFIKSLKDVMKWSFLPYSDVWVVGVSLIMFLSFILVTLVFGKSRNVNRYSIVCIFSYVLYYIAVKVKLDSFTNYAGSVGTGNRYNLFLIPIWIIWFFLLFYSLYGVIDGLRSIKKDLYKEAMQGIGIALVIGYSFVMWNGKIADNWDKSGIQGAVYSYYYLEGQNTPLFVFYTQNSGAAYYVTTNKKYNDTVESNVKYIDYMFSTKTTEEWTEYFTNLYPDGLPAFFYLITAGSSETAKNMNSCFVNQGYNCETKYDNQDVRLLYFSLAE